MTDMTTPHKDKELAIADKRLSDISLGLQKPRVQAMNKAMTEMGADCVVHDLDVDGQRIRVGYADHTLDKEEGYNHAEHGSHITEHDAIVAVKAMGGEKVGMDKVKQLFMHRGVDFENKVWAKKVDPITTPEKVAHPVVAFEAPPTRLILLDACFP